MQSRPDTAAGNAGLLVLIGWLAGAFVGEGLTREQEDAARLAVSRLAGHHRGRASAAYLGAVLHKKKGGAKGGADGGAAGGDAAA